MQINPGRFGTLIKARLCFSKELFEIEPPVRGPEFFKIFEG